jgi:hypothetical protein
VLIDDSSRCFLCKKHKKPENVKILGILAFSFILYHYKMKKESLLFKG